MPAADYSTKGGRYFSGARRLFVDDLPVNSNAKLLEVGCGNGDTAAYALATKKCGWSAGIELCEQPAIEARSRLNQVLIGDVEQMELPFSAENFDILIMSEVIEHLRDPWKTLKRLRGFLKPGAIILAGSPNVAHHSVLRMLVSGRWDYTDVGIMDMTHLRWFTPDTYRKLFEDCGYEVTKVAPAVPLRWKARMVDALLLHRMTHLFHSQIYLQARYARPI